MYQLYSTEDQSADPLIEAVIKVSGQEGPEGLTARRISSVAGTSPSTINYKYASIDDLKSAAWTVADARLAEAWRSAQLDLADLKLEISDLAPMLFATIRRILVEHRGCHSVFWEALLQHSRAGLPFEAPQSYLAERAFFASLLNALERQQDETPLLHTLALALRFGYLMFREPSHFDAWAFALVQRFCERFSGAAPHLASDSAARVQAETAIAVLQMPSTSRHETAVAILAAARAIAMQQGAPALTHRAVASRAGLSVSSVQHFYGSSASLLSAVYMSVLTDMRDKTVPELPKPHSLTNADVVEKLLFAAPGTERPSSGDQVALLGLLLSASRRSETRSLAHGFLANVGKSSAVMLNAMKAPRGVIGRLDAQLFSLCSAHFAILELCESPHTDPTPEWAQFMKQLIGSLFI